jgi:hypothetical protein
MRTSNWSGTLVRELRARIVDISQSGCLIGTRRRLEVGAVGTLQMQLGTGEFRDDFEVVRCQAVEGERSLYHVAVRFLWTTPRHICSIRYAVALHAAELEPPDSVP